MKCRKKDFVNNILNVKGQDINSRLIVHSSGMISSEFCATSIFLPLIRDPLNQNGVIAWDLRFDPDVLINLDNDLERARYLLYTPQEDLKPGESRLGLKHIYANKVPSVAPITTVCEESYKRIKLDEGLVYERAQRLLNYIESWHDMLIELFSDKPSFESIDVEHELYNKFIPNNDKYICNRVHITPDDKLPDLTEKFTDSRLKELLFRYRARNFYDTLSNEEICKWQEYCQIRINNLNNTSSISKIDFINKSNDIMKNAPNNKVLQSWLDYISKLDVLENVAC